MENASKSLLIAGAILLAILLISLGIFLYNNAGEMAILKTSSETNEIQLIKFNNQYLMYEGNQKGSNVKTLLNYAANNNETLYKDKNSITDCVCIRTKIKEIIDSFSENSMKVGLNGSRSYGVYYPENIYRIMNVIKSSKTYNIEFKYNDKGYIWEIWINDVQ
jgi:ribosomal protein S4E